MTVRAAILVALLLAGCVTSRPSPRTAELITASATTAPATTTPNIISPALTATPSAAPLPTARPLAEEPVASPTATSQPTDPSVDSVAVAVTGLDLVGPSGVAQSLPFGTDLPTVAQAVESILGVPHTRTPIPTCPGLEDAVAIAYPNELTLTFDGDTFVGWYVPPDGGYATTTDAVIPGMSPDQLRRVRPDVTVIEREDADSVFKTTPGGLTGLLVKPIDDLVVGDVWSGSICIFDPTITTALQ